MNNKKQTQPPSSLVIGLLALSGLASAVAAQPPVLESPISEVIDVRVVNVEVVVEEKGARVRGLGPQDFILEVDGREVAVEYFTEVEGGQAIERAGQSDSTVPALAPGSAVGTSYLVFVDDFFTRPPDRDRVLDGLIEQLPNLTPQDRMAIVAYDGKKIDMLTTWSQDLADLTRVLRKAKDRPAYGLQRTAEQRIFESARDLEDLRNNARRGSQANQGDFRRSVDLEEEQLAQRISDQVRRATTAAASALRSFANPPGRKVMMIYSGGWPSDPGNWVTSDPYLSARLTGVRRGEQLTGPLADNANRLGYTLYMIDVPGIVNTGVDASESTLEESTRLLDRRRHREVEEEATLYQLAERTGGRALVNSNNVDAFERVVADTRSYYWLGFTPAWKGDDSQHKVEVKLRKKGPEIRTRKGFSDLSRASEVNMMVESSLLFGDPPTSEPLQVEVGRGQKSGFSLREVPLKVFIPLHALTFVPGGEGYVSDAELRVAVLDDDGNSSEIPVVPLIFSGKGPPKAGVIHHWETKLKMRTKRHDLVVSIYDKISGKILSAKVEVPKL
jgi:VWFA-related protein